MPDGSLVKVPRICDVPIGHLHFIWPQARQHLSKAVARTGGRFLLSDILERLLAGQARLWVSWDGGRVEMAALTETIQYPQLRELRVWMIGGENMRAWKDEFMSVLEEFARSDGCAILAAGGRVGWLRIIGPSWGNTGMTCEKRLD